MSLIKNPFELALKFENAKCYFTAYSIFKDCLQDSRFQKGDLYFHCGWCTENLKVADKTTAIQNYLLAAELADEIICRVNSYFRAGWLFMHLDQPQNAIECYLKAIELSGNIKSITGLYSESLYWCGVCFEKEKRFIEAIKNYRIVKNLSVSLNPECRYRETISLIQIGAYEEALQVIRSFDFPAPDKFPEKRYAELKELVNKEKRILRYCFSNNHNAGDYANNWS